MAAVIYNRLQRRWLGLDCDVRYAAEQMDRSADQE